MARAVKSNLDFENVAKIVNLPDPSSAQDAATKAYVDSAVEGLAWKDSVRVASVANINLSSPGATIDGITMSSGDRFLAKDQSTASENGIYVWNGAAVAATRALDASTAAELEQAITTVEEGTHGGTSWRQTSVNFTLGSASIAWTLFGTGVSQASETTAGIAELATQSETDTGTDDARIVTPLKLANWSGRKRKHTATIGDGSATQFDVTHNFNTRDVTVEVYRNGTPWDTILCDVSRPDTNTVRLNFASAPTSNQFAVTILA